LVAHVAVLHVAVQDRDPRRVPAWIAVARCEIFT
jgi:hypothetical protein